MPRRVSSPRRWVSPRRDYNPRMKRRVWVVAKTVFGFAVILGVGLHFWNTLNRAEFSRGAGAIHWPLLVPAALLYLVNHTIWGTFWWRLLRHERQPVDWPRAVSTYFISQFGKYVPGKAWVIVLRVALLRRHGASRAAVAVTGVFETLTSMAAGALIGIAALPATGLKLPFAGDRWPLFAAVAGVPLVLAVLLRLAQRMIRHKSGPAASLPVPSLRLLAAGLLMTAVGWCCLAISLQLVVSAVRPESAAFTAQAFLANLATVTLSYVAGFVILVAPGGLGVREWVLAALIASRFGDSVAAADGVIIALLLRLAWTSAEVLTAGTLWLTERRSRHD